MTKFPQEYLGDGVYASFDGYYIWLHVNSHDAEPVVALEPPVLAALNRYFDNITRPVIDMDQEVPFAPEEYDG